MAADSVWSPAFAIGSSATRNGRLKTRFTAWQTAGVPRTSTATALFARVRADTLRAAVRATGGQVTAFTADR